VRLLFFLFGFFVMDSNILFQSDRSHYIRVSNYKCVWDKPCCFYTFLVMLAYKTVKSNLKCTCLSYPHFLYAGDFILLQDAVCYCNKHMSWISMESMHVPCKLLCYSDMLQTSKICINDWEIIFPMSTYSCWPMQTSGIV